MREKLPPEQKKTVSVTIPLTEAGKGALHEAARRMKLPPVTWARSVLLQALETVLGTDWVYEPPAEPSTENEMSNQDINRDRANTGE